MNNAKDDGDRRDYGENRRRTIRLKLCDGAKTCVHAMEYRPINSLHLSLPNGTKMTVLTAYPCRIHPPMHTSRLKKHEKCRQFTPHWGGPMRTAQNGPNNGNKPTRATRLPSFDRSKHSGALRRSGRPCQKRGRRKGRDYGAENQKEKAQWPFIRSLVSKGATLRKVWDEWPSPPPPVAGGMPPPPRVERPPLRPRVPPPNSNARAAGSDLVRPQMDTKQTRKSNEMGWPFAPESPAAKRHRKAWNAPSRRQ